MVDRNINDLFNSVIEIGPSQIASNQRSGGSGTSRATAEVPDEVEENLLSDFQEYKRKCREEYKERWKEDDKILQAHQDAIRARFIREHGKIPDLSHIDDEIQF